MRAAVSVLGLAARNQAFIGDTFFCGFSIREWGNDAGLRLCALAPLRLCALGAEHILAVHISAVGNQDWYCPFSSFAWRSSRSAPQWAGGFPAPSGRAYCVCLGLWVVPAKRLEGVYSFSALSCSLTACTFSAICASSSLRRSTFLASSPRRLLPDFDLALRKVRLVS